jgi:hypothetical protein
MALRCDPGSSWRRPAGSGWLLAKQRQPRTPAAEPVEAPQRPALQEVSQFMLLEREVEIQYRPRMREAWQNKVNTVADSLRDQTPACSRCSQPMKRHDTETVSWGARFGRLHASVALHMVGSQARRHRFDALSLAVQQQARTVIPQGQVAVSMPRGLRQPVQICREAFLLWCWHQGLSSHKNIPARFLFL